MEFLQFTLTLIAVFLGTIGGWLLSWIAPEELVPGRKYFKFALKFFTLLIIMFFIYSVNLYLFAEIIFVILLFLIIIFFPIRTNFFYPFAALILAAASENIAIFSIQSVLIFIYGLLISSIYCIDYVKNDKFTIPISKILLKLLLRYSGFIIVGIISFLLLLICS